MDIRINTNAPIPKLDILYDKERRSKYEYFLLHGGRGGGKTEEVSRFLIINSFSDSGHILCTREVQNSIEDSVKATLEHWISELGVSEWFYITNKEIVNKITGAKFMFKGMNAGTKKDSIKSIKGLKYVWVEEAQSISLRSIEKLDPTVRTDGRMLIFTYNPEKVNDAVNSLADFGDLVCNIEINYMDNPYCPQVLLTQAERMKAMYPELFKHIWLGQPRTVSDAYTVLPYGLLKRCVGAHKKLAKLYPDRQWTGGHAYGGLDLAPGEEEKHDKNSYTFVKGSVVLFSDHWQSSDLGAIGRKVKREGERRGLVRLFFDAVGVGGFANGTLKKLKPKFLLEPHMGGSKVFGKEMPFMNTGSTTKEGVITNGDYFKNAKAQMWWNLRLRIENTVKLLDGKVDEVKRKDYVLCFDEDNPHLEKLLIELSQATYTEDAAGRVIIDKAPGDKEVELEDGKKKKVRSPNLADSCGYAFLRSCKNGLKSN